MKCWNSVIMSWSSHSRTQLKGPLCLPVLTQLYPGSQRKAWYVTWEGSLVKFRLMFKPRNCKGPPCTFSANWSCTWKHSCFSTIWVSKWTCFWAMVSRSFRFANAVTPPRVYQQTVSGVSAGMKVASWQKNCAWPVPKVKKCFSRAKQRSTARWLLFCRVVWFWHVFASLWPQGEKKPLGRMVSMVNRFSSRC